MIVPVTALGFFGALSGPLLTTNETPDLLKISKGLPRTFLWTWFNVLVFSINNQYTSEAVLEDSINKPWRPIPAGRINSSQARRLLLATIPSVFLFSVFWLGAAQETLLCYCLTWIYNDLGGADEHFLLRNFLNGMAYLAYGSGALRVSCGGKVEPLSDSYTWLTFVAAIIFTTMQIQDLQDQKGDRARRRHTAPLILGDQTTRWTICIGVLIWSAACPLYWNLETHASIVPLSLGTIVAARVLWLRTETADRNTYAIWSLWLMSLFLSPLIKEPSVFKNLNSVL